MILSRFVQSFSFLTLATHRQTAMVGSRQTSATYQPTGNVAILKWSAFAKICPFIHQAWINIGKRHAGDVSAIFSPVPSRQTTTAGLTGL